MEQKIYKDRELKELNEVAKIAKFYGFQPLTPPTVQKHDFDLVKNFEDTSLSEKASLIRIYFEEKMMASPQPSMLYCERPFPGGKDKKKPLKLEASLVTLGSTKSVCECLSLQTALKILDSLGYKDLEIHINSVGDKDSMSEFQRKLTLFIRKNYNTFPPDLRQATKKDIYSILRGPKEEWQKFQAECPKSIDFLSEPSRLHFKEALEFLEIMDIPYQIDHFLLNDPDVGSETVFRIVNTKENNEILAEGMRFNRLAKKIGYKKDLGASILNISAKLKKNLKKVKVRVSKPQFYLVQFGTEAKLRSFLILEQLHKAGVSVIHSIAKDKLSSQIGIAETSEAPYILLIGQKEALENSVLIRNTLTRAQTLVPIPELASRIKELH